MYIYDAWNRLVKVRASNDSDVTIQTAEFDATGRRINKNVTDSGGLDAKTRYYYDGPKIIETRVGTETVMNQQFIHGTQYIDEVLMVRVKGKGDLYVHQDANWNVIGLTDLAGSVVERYKYTPYGVMQVDQETGFGDRDGDGDVDATDKGTPGTDCTGTVAGACRVLDLDFDGDYDSADATLFDALPQGEMLHPGRIATSVDQPFGHQGLLFEPEIGSFQNRARQYDPATRRFAQRDPFSFGMRTGSGGYYWMNLYQSRRARPTSTLDPTGQFDICNDISNLCISACTGVYLWCARQCESGECVVRCSRREFACIGGCDIILAVCDYCTTPDPDVGGVCLPDGSCYTE